MEIKKIQMKNDKIDKIFFILLCLIIVSLHLFIGSSHQEPKTILEMVIIIIGIIYILIKKIQGQKNVVIKGKIDILIFSLLIVIIIPLIIKTYYSLNDTINFFLAFLCVFVVYILARNLIKTKNDLNGLIDITLISSIMIVVFGLDELYYNVFEKFLNAINSAKSQAYGMVSTIGYSNPVAAYMALLAFFALGRYLSIQNKWIKNLYSIYIQIAMIGFVFGNSRALMLIFPLVFIMYIITLKNNKNRLQAIGIMGINTIAAYIFQETCNRIVTDNMTLWGLLLLDIIIIYLISYAISSIHKKINVKISKTVTLILILGIALFTTIYYMLVKDIGSTIEIKDETQAIDLLGLKNDYDYNLKIDIIAEIQEDEETKIKLDLYTSERTIYQSETQNIKNGNQTFEFDVHTNKDFERVIVRISGLKHEQSKIVVNHIYINNKEYIFNFKYLPNDVIRMLRTLNPRTVSIYERVHFYKDALNLSKEHIIFGAGDKAFANHIKPYQTYIHGYIAESHSYIADMLLNHGIFGLVTYIVIIILTAKTALKTIKQKKQENDSNLALYISILFGMIMFTLHAAIDFDLVYLLTLCMYYMFIGILNKEDNKLKFNNSYIDYVMVIILIIALGILTCRLISSKFIKQGEYGIAYAFCSYRESTKKHLIDEAFEKGETQKLEKFLPIYIQDEKYKNNIGIINKFNYVISENLKNHEFDKANEFLEILYKYVTENDNFSKADQNEMEIKRILINNLLTRLQQSQVEVENEQIKIWYNKFKTI